MNRKISYIKILILLADIICVFLSHKFWVDIQNRGNAKEIMELEEKNTILENTLKEKQEATDSFFNTYVNTQSEIEQCKKEYKELETLYNTKMYIDSISAEFYQNREVNPYIERYFRIEREEIQNVIQGQDFEQSPFNEQGETFLPIGDKIWLQYKEKDRLASGLLIKNPEINIGCYGAKAGMDWGRLKDKIPEAEMGNIFWDDENIQYLQCEDKYYYYYFLEIYGQPTFLYIMKKG